VAIDAARTSVGDCGVENQVGWVGVINYLPKNIPAMKGNKK
jgi:hypothetical protein